LPVARLLALSLTLCLVGLQLGPARAADLLITLISVTSPAAPFSDATLTISTSPGANCSIVVHYSSGPSRAKGLIPKMASSSGRVSWTWRVGSNTTPGRWPIIVTCEKPGSAPGTAWCLQHDGEGPRGSGLWYSSRRPVIHPKGLEILWHVASGQCLILVIRAVSGES